MHSASLKNLDCLSKIVSKNRPVNYDLHGLTIAISWRSCGPKINFGFPVDSNLGNIISGPQWAGLDRFREVPIDLDGSE